jgi:hypothetical protein
MSEIARISAWGGQGEYCDGYAFVGDAVIGAISVARGGGTNVAP